jgi:hypothetical protein
VELLNFRESREHYGLLNFALPAQILLRTPGRLLVGLMLDEDTADKSHSFNGIIYVSCASISRICIVKWRSTVDLAVSHDTRLSRTPRRPPEWREEACKPRGNIWF